MSPLSSLLSILVSIVMGGTAIWVYITNGLKVLGDTSLHWSVFAIVGTISATYAIARFGQMVVNRLPSRRFGECYHTIVQCRDSAKECTQTDDMNDPSQLELYAAVSEISETLRRFGVQCPSANPDDWKYTVLPSVRISTAHPDGRTYAAAWFKFLTSLAPLAQHKDLREARKLLNKDSQ